MNQSYREAVVLPLDQYEQLTKQNKVEEPKVEEPLTQTVLNYAKASSYFDYDKNSGVMVLNGRHIPGSNIWDILTISSLAKPSEFPNGLQEFLQLLAYDTDMGALLLPSKRFRDYINRCRMSPINKNKPSN